MMRFVSTILCRGPEVERHRRYVAERRYGVGDGIEAADVAMFGPVVYVRPDVRNR